LFLFFSPWLVYIAVGLETLLPPPTGTLETLVTVATVQLITHTAAKAIQSRFGFEKYNEIRLIFVIRDRFYDIGSNPHKSSADTKNQSSPPLSPNHGRSIFSMSYLLGTYVIRGDPRDEILMAHSGKIDWRPFTRENRRDTENNLKISRFHISARINIVTVINRDPGLKISAFL